jgi:sterol desaturase/sphingolipid hydroxylase (fatty acid hydroxylase superfamily)
MDIVRDAASFVQRLLDPFGLLHFIRLGDGWYVMPLVGFIAVSLALYCVSAVRARQFSLKDAVGYIFPASVYKGRQTFVHLWLYALNYVFILKDVALIGASFWTSAQVYEVLVQNLGPSPFVIPVGWGLVVFQTIALFMIGEFGLYIQHYVMHKAPFFWQFHSVHHSAEQLNPFFYPTHPLDALVATVVPVAVNTVFYAFVFYFSGSSAIHASGIILVLLTVWAFFQFFQHSHIWVSFGPLNYIFISPAMHHIHHSAERHHFDKNIGGVTTFWDWVFGTLYVPKGREVFDFGLDHVRRGENHPYQSVKEILFLPFINAFRIIVPKAGTAGKEASSAAPLLCDAGESG